MIVQFRFKLVNRTAWLCAFMMMSVLLATPGLVRAEEIPEAFSQDYLSGKTFYVVWFGRGEDANGNELDGDVPVVLQTEFSADGTAVGTGLLNTTSWQAPWAVDGVGLLYFNGLATEGNRIACDHTDDFIRTHYLNEEGFDNVDLFFFDRQKALDYAATLNRAPEPCPNGPGLTPSSVVRTQPADNAAGVAVDQLIVVQFDRSMVDFNCDLAELESWIYAHEDIGGPISWTQTLYPKDTLTFVPDTRLLSSMYYEVDLECRNSDGFWMDEYSDDLEFNFITAGALGDDSAPQVTSTSPYAGQSANVTLPIYILFDKPIDPASVTTESLQVTGPGAPTYRWRSDGYILTLWPQGLQARSDYQVTLTTAVTDGEGHGLAAPYSFGFNTGAGDTTAPRILQTLPADQGTLAEWNGLHVFFSENMDPDGFRADVTVAVFDETNGDTPIGIALSSDYVDVDGPNEGIEIRRAFAEGGRWQVGHTYRVELAGTIADLWGNPLGRDQVLRFTVVDWNDAPPNLERSQEIVAQRHPDGRVTIDIEIEAWSTTGSTLDLEVTDLTQTGKRWGNFQFIDNRYIYSTPDGGDEGLTVGNHDLRITATDPSNGQTRSLLWNLHVFNAAPTLTGSPADGATGVSLEPEFSFATNGIVGAAAYEVMLTGVDAGDAFDHRIPILRDTRLAYSLPIPHSRALEPNKTYRWKVRAVAEIETDVGLAFSEERTFTTGARDVDALVEVIQTGTGQGTVSGGGRYPIGATVTLSAIPEEGSSFDGWTPSPCASSFMMPAEDLVCAAVFTAAPTSFPLIVGTVGQGTVTSDPAGIECTADAECSANFPSGTTVTLTATPETDYRFDGWGGACTGFLDCLLTIAEAQSVTANFIPVSSRYQLDSPVNGSSESGIGVVHGWVCEAGTVSLQVDEQPAFQAAYGTVRPDSQTICGDGDNGFAAAINWNDYGDGPHTLKMLADGIVLTRASVNVTTLGETFLQGLNRQITVDDFPRTGERTVLAWSEPHQNFVVGSASRAQAQAFAAQSLAIGSFNWESPAIEGAESGLSLIRGWACDATQVSASLDGGSRIAIPTGSERTDTQGICGDADNGYALAINWNLIGEGPHSIALYLDGVLTATRAFTVATPAGQGNVSGVQKQQVVRDFPALGDQIRLQWSEPHQNFRITHYQDANELVTLDTASPSIVGAGLGDDTYLLDPARLSGGERMTLSDTQGTNRLQLVEGLSIRQSQVAPTALRLILSNGAQVTVLGANAFRYQVGEGSLVSFGDFAQTQLGVTVPTSGTATGGAVTITAP